jgi:hypothetical protein
VISHVRTVADFLNHAVFITDRLEKEDKFLILWRTISHIQRSVAS